VDITLYRRVVMLGDGCNSCSVVCNDWESLSRLFIDCFPLNVKIGTAVQYTACERHIFEGIHCFVIVR
jgi:hypothetical protein